MNARKFAFAAAPLTFAFLAAPAAAQDKPSFTGARIEAEIGWDQLRFDLGRYGLAGTGSKSGLGYGGNVGFDLPLGTSVIAGVQAGVNFSSADASFTDGTSAWTQHARRDIELSGRVGAKLSDAMLLYAKAGYTNFQLGQDAVAGGVTTSTRSNLDGIRVGAGAEFALSRSLYAKAEYDYSNYQDGVAKNDVLTGIGIRF